MCTEIYLASASPRRYDILQQLGYVVHQVPANIDECPHPSENAHDYVRRMAQQKNEAAHQMTDGAYPLISADTVVVSSDVILGKPASVAEAKAMLMALSGRVHHVLTAVCVALNGQTQTIIQDNEVCFKPLSAEEIDAYVRTGEAMDKAGAYGIQGRAGAFVAHLSGSFTGVMGLPVYETMALLRDLGCPAPPFMCIK